MSMNLKEILAALQARRLSPEQGKEMLNSCQDELEEPKSPPSLPLTDFSSKYCCSAIEAESESGPTGVSLDTLEERSGMTSTETDTPVLRNSGFSAASDSNGGKAVRDVWPTTATSQAEQEQGQKQEKENLESVIRPIRPREREIKSLANLSYFPCSRRSLARWRSCTNALRS